MDMDSYIDLENDVFFEEIKRRVLLLMIEDEEEDSLEVTHPSLSKRGNSLPSLNTFDYSNHQHDASIQESRSSISPQLPAQRLPKMVWLQRESNGTGVFIPQCLPVSGRKAESGPMRQGRQCLQPGRLPRR